MLANGKLFRQIESMSANPNYTFTSTTEGFSLGEVAAPIIVFGDMDHGTVSRSFVEYFFGKWNNQSECHRDEFGIDRLVENERLPSELGWTKKSNPVTLEQIGRMSQLIGNATNLLTGGNAPETVDRRDLHGGRMFWN